MDPQSMLPVLIWLVLAVEGAQSAKAVKDNVSASSVPQLYTSAHKAYASGVPYQDASSAGSHLVPVKEETLVIRNNNGYLKDSYGNNFVESPQKFAYKMTYPQQYVKLQDLPLHLSQPLSLASQTYASAPQFSYGTSHRLSPQATKAIRLSTSAFSDAQSLAPQGIYSQALKALSLTPQQLSSNQKPIYTSKQPYKYYANSNNEKFQRLEQKPSHGHRNPNSEAYHNVKYNKANLKKAPVSAPQKHYIIKTKDGKKTAVTLTTNPPIPNLLDLSLLKPLTFANPIVPQVQHYLPKINYHIPKLDEERKQHNEFVVTKTKTYDSGNIKDDPQNEDSEENDSSEEHDDDHSYEEEEVRPSRDEKPQNPPQKPSIKVSGNPASPVHSYEINSPGYKESFSQQVVNYGKNTEGKPVVYSYDMKIEKKPVHYTYSHSSNKPPTHSKQVHIKEEHNGVPVVYSESPNSSEEVDEDDHSMEYEEAPRQSHQPREQAPSSPRPNYMRAEHGEVQYHVQPQHQQHSLPHNAPRQQIPHPYSSPHFSQIQVPIQDMHLNLQPFQLEEDLHYVPTPATQLNTNHGHLHHSSPQNKSPQNHVQHAPVQTNYETVQGNNGYHFGQHESLSTRAPHLHHEHQPTRPPHENKQHPSHYENREISQSHGNNQQHESHPTTSPNAHQERHGNNNYNVQHESHPTSPSHANKQHYGHLESHPNLPLIHGNIQKQGHIDGHSLNQHNVRHHESQPKNPQNIHDEGHPHSRPNLQESYPTNHGHPGNNGQPNSQELNEFRGVNQEFPQLNGFQPSFGNLQQPSHPPSSTAKSLQQPHPPSSTYSPTTSQIPYSSVAPHIVEKSHKIIIQDESPDEMHSHKEQTTSAVVDNEENNEQDFDKLYKEAAVGFPAYDRDDDANEREIFNPDNYAPDHHVQFNIEQNPFQQYVEEGDEFPKSARLSYKDAQENMKEDYYLDYSVKKPESLMDRYKNKIDYYKMFKNHRQPKNWGVVLEDQQPKKSEPYAVETFYGYAPQHKQGFFAQYKNGPKFEYDYSKEAPRDSFAHASKPIYRAKTHFVEPQFQYGFEPLTIPNLFDSELSAMASNDSPKSDKDGKRKKIYKENWYIKKTTTSGGKPAS